MDVWGLRALLCVVVVVGCAVAVGPVAVVAEPATGVDASDAVVETTQQDDPTSAALQEDVSAETTLENADGIVVRVHVIENGSATLDVEYRYELEGADANVDWDAIEEDVDSNPDAYVEEESESWQATLDRAQNETEREMELSGGTVTTERSSAPVELGHIRFQFEWSAFASVELNRIEAGDALTGFTLVDRARLALSWPDGYNATAVQPDPTTLGETSATWNGEQSTFDEPGHPQVELIESGSESSGSDDEPIGGAVVWWVALIALGGVGLVALVVTRRAGRQPGESDAKRDDTEPTPGQSVPPQTPPPELLSNEERVLQLLEQYGGRLKQQQVVAELGWTEAKTSQVVSGLREADEIDVFRIGRENVLVLPDDE